MEIENKPNVNFVSCVKWVKKGIAKFNPDKVQLTKVELARMIQETRRNLRVSEKPEEGNEGQPSTNPSDEFGLQNYDNDEDEDEENPLGLNSLAEVPEADENYSDTDESEKEDDFIKPKDSLILVGHVEGDASILEVYVYNEEEESLYVHHDILLPSFPLCLEWLDKETGHPPGSYCAVGTMGPIIQVWDLDVVNCLEPAYKLGRKGSRKRGTTTVGHKDAVLDLSWNKNYDHILASGSADKTIHLWDLDVGEPATTLNAFSDKVQCLEWHRLEAQTLLAGSADQTVKIFDCRNPETNQSWQVDGEVERVCWNPLQPFSFFASTSVGKVQYFDCRKGQIWSIEAHEKEVTGLTISAQCPGLLITASADGSLKVWDMNEESEPVMAVNKEFDLGVVHCVELCPDLPFVIAAGGDNKSKNFLVYDLRNVDPVRHRFESRNLIQLVPEESVMDTDTLEQTTN
ncbi:periodic tryptophan protein 1 homolog [Agrilus planipennis]|uniref:Periodic tryptophan protein 1 homolog n=1 Tax=Agrilus planipennis TaxID=224129 RepID=A0A1W4WLB0_AGRPL|nr:periodic tryptophan protein 1 homolog [Agrilus planipennis]